MRVFACCTIGPVSSYATEGSVHAQNPNYRYKHRSIILFASSRCHTVNKVSLALSWPCRPSEPRFASPQNKNLYSSPIGENQISIKLSNFYFWTESFRSKLSSFAYCIAPLANTCRMSWSPLRKYLINKFENDANLFTTLNLKVDLDPRIINWTRFDEVSVANDKRISTRKI